MGGDVDWSTTYETFPFEFEGVGEGNGEGMRVGAIDGTEEKDWRPA